MGTFPSLSEATQSGVFNVLVTEPDIFNETWEHILPVVFTVTASSYFIVTNQIFSMRNQDISRRTRDNKHT